MAWLSVGLPGPFRVSFPLGGGDPDEQIALRSPRRHNPWPVIGRLLLWTLIAGAFTVPMGWIVAVPLIAAMAAVRLRRHRKATAKLPTARPEAVPTPTPRPPVFAGRPVDC